MVDSPLQGSWVLDSIGTADVVSSIIAGTDPTLDITSDGISGSSGCNSFFGSLRWDRDGSFAVSEMGWTEMACQRPVMRQEKAVLDTLGGAARYEIDGDTLLISTSSGDRFLRYVRAG